jgi:hypothetical protein
MATNTKLAKVNQDRTLSFLKPGRPTNDTFIIEVDGKPLQALLSGKTVKLTKGGNFRVVSNSSSFSA